MTDSSQQRADRMARLDRELRRFSLLQRRAALQRAGQRRPARGDRAAQERSA